MQFVFKANNYQHFQNEVSTLAARFNSKPHIVSVVIDAIEEEIAVNTWFLCFQQTGSNRYASVTSDPTLLDDVELSLEFQHRANDWTWFDTVRLHNLIVEDAEYNPDGCMVEDWEEGRCEVVDGVLGAIPDFPEDDEPEIEPDDDYSHWNEEAEIVRRMENPEIDGRY